MRQRIFGKGATGLLGVRLATAVAGIPILVGLVVAGGWVLTIGIGILATVSVLEVYQMFRRRAIPFGLVLAGLWVWALLLSVPLHYPLGATALAGVACTGLLSLTRHEAEGFLGALTTAWLALYLGGFFSFLLAIRALPEGRVLALGFFAVIWATDTAAFFVGRSVGGPKLWPRVSPAKTWAGALAGAAAGMLVGGGLAVWLGDPGWEGLLLGIAVSALGQVGDLVESNLKRYAGVKDSGHILPGHGGILDRFDSALFALPAAYYLLKGLGM